jgi:hypothetical protein
MEFDVCVRTELRKLPPQLVKSWQPVKKLHYLVVFELLFEYFLACLAIVLLNPYLEQLRVRR